MGPKQYYHSSDLFSIRKTRRMGLNSMFSDMDITDISMLLTRNLYKCKVDDAPEDILEETM